MPAARTKRPRNASAMSISISTFTCGNCDNAAGLALWVTCLLGPLNNGDIAMSVTIYHNPSCGTSRNTLAMIRQSGVEPTVIEYLKTPPSRDKLKELVSAMGISVRALLREKGT